MTESEAKRIFDEKLPLCDVLGLDVRAACIEAGVPADMVDALLRADKAMTSAIDVVITDPKQLPQEPPFESGFACLSQKRTGLPMLVWSLVKSDLRQTPHVLVQVNHSATPQIKSTVRVSIEETPRLILGEGLENDDFTTVKAFIARNRAALLGHWNGVGSAAELIAGIERVAR